MPDPRQFPTQGAKAPYDLPQLFAARMQPWTPSAGEEVVEEAVLNDEQRRRLAAALPFAASPRRRRPPLSSSVAFSRPATTATAGPTGPTATAGPPTGPQTAMEAALEAATTGPQTTMEAATAAPAGPTGPTAPSTGPSTGLTIAARDTALEWLLGYGAPARRATATATATATALLTAYGSFERVADQPAELLARASGLSDSAATLLNLIPALLRRVLAAPWSEHPVLTEPEQYSLYCAALLFGFTVERLMLLCLDGRNRLIRSVVLQQGTLDKVALHPREILVAARRYDARYVILTHNHPGASCNPSQNDLQMTHVVAQAMQPHHISLLDHVIVTERQWYSFFKNNMMPRL